MAGYYTNFCLTAEQKGRRLDKCLAEFFSEHTRVGWQKTIRAGEVAVNNETCLRVGRIVGGRDNIAARSLPPPPSPSPAEMCQPEELPLDVVYEDDAMIVVNKAAGMVAHPGNGNLTGTLQSALMFRHPPSASLPRGGIVHRLDKDTSGLMAAAKTDSARLSLIAQFKSRSARREYLALAHGSPPATGLINRPLSPKRHAPGKMEVSLEGKEAITRYEVLQAWPGFSLLRCRLETGRTHQIRAHLEHIGHPIVGDPVYCRRARPLPFSLSRQALHAERLHLLHPETAEEKTWHTPPPPDFQTVLRFLGEAVDADGQGENQ